jgi:8-oxo-dGTP diphosphatase
VTKHGAHGTAGNFARARVTKDGAHGTAGNFARARVTKDGAHGTAGNSARAVGAGIGDKSSGSRPARRSPQPDRRGLRDHGSVGHAFEPESGVPRIPASAGALIFDPAGRLLLLKPTYKKRWSLPGGQIEATGESPWDACRRETREECSLEIVGGRLVCVDFLRPRPNRPGGMRFLFDCGTFPGEALAAIKLQQAEISAHRFEDPSNAAGLLSGPVGRRVGAVIGATGCVYLEDGRPVPAIESF